MTLLVKFKLH